MRGEWGYLEVVLSARGTNDILWERNGLPEVGGNYTD